jgi:heme O synthase-like polyprenyltransferase
VEQLIFVIPIVGIVFGIGVAAFAIWTEHKRDMALIEKGLYQTKKPGPPGQTTLAWGLVLALVGIAFTIASLSLSDPEMLLPGLLLTALGIALLIYTAIVKRQKPVE